MKKIAILGSTGSIGTQTLDVIRANPDKLKVISLVAFSNKEKLNAQVAEFSPKYSTLISECGNKCLVDAVQGCDIAVVATRGIAALDCVLYCLEHGIDVALANKEVLVCAGSVIMSKVGKSRLIPVDSEHSAIMQCLAGKSKLDLHKILLTASGGPFLELSKEELRNVTAQQALRHPNWNMGAKITIDSATMMNKALEVIEAHWLFDVPVDKIQIVVHRQSVVHSMVEWKSGSIVAQLATPDMRLPIQLALLGESDCIVDRLDFGKLQKLDFQPCDFDKFPCARFGYELDNYPPLCPTIMNAANDVCVEKFLSGEFSFCRFYDTIMSVVKHFTNEVAKLPVTVENIEKFDSLARQYTTQQIAISR